MSYRGEDRQSERGITLVEVVVVGILASIVMVALTGFYINSQGTWIEASTQAVTQREASLVLETIVDSVHTASSAVANSGTHTLILNDETGVERCRFWMAGDSLIHLGKGTTIDFGPIANSRVTRFDISADASMVRVHALELRSANRMLVRMSTAAYLFNRIGP